MGGCGWVGGRALTAAAAVVVRRRHGAAEGGGQRVHGRQVQWPRRRRRLAVRETVILLHPPLPSVGASIWIERGCQQNKSVADCCSRRGLPEEHRSVADRQRGPAGTCDTRKGDDMSGTAGTRD